MNFAVSPRIGYAIHPDRLRLVAIALPVKRTVTACIAFETGVNPLLPLSRTALCAVVQVTKFKLGTRAVDRSYMELEALGAWVGKERKR